MSISLYLHCNATNECVSTLIVGSAPVQRLQPNVMGAFLAYHANLHTNGATDFTLRNIDDRELENAVIWDEGNYRDLMGRDPSVANAQRDFERAPSGGLWKLLQVHSTT